jgi:hypothetical protein
MPLGFTQTVTLRNVSHPETHIEVGNIVEVRISGAAPFGTVTVVENGGSPYEFGTTGSSGNWSVTATESSAEIGPYTQTWYFDGVAMTPESPNIYLPYQPIASSFTVYANFVGTNDAPQSTIGIVGCGASNNAMHWK